jgi:carboxymethylenebutenolidase
MTNDDRSHIEELAHLYVDGAFDRRELLKRVAGVTGSIAAAAVALESLGLAAERQDARADSHRGHGKDEELCSCPEDPRVPEDARDLEVMQVEFPGEAGVIFAHRARPRHGRRRRKNADDAASDAAAAAAGAATTSSTRGEPLPGILVIHENRGLNEHIRDVTRRAARAGYVALGIDLLSRFGGTPSDPEEALRLYQQTTPEGRLADMLSALAYLQGLDIVRGDKLGAVGFCAGGGNVWSLALNSDLLAAAVAFYGAPVPPIDALANLRPPILGIYAELDRNLTRGTLPIIVRLEELQKPFGFHIYEGTRHAFHNDTGANYDRLAACDAWCKTTKFFEKHLVPADSSAG